MIWRISCLQPDGQGHVAHSYLENILEALQLFKCLSDDTRLKTCLLLAKHEELCVCELVEALDVIQPKISRHLAQLRNCGLLQDRKNGQWVFYKLHPDLPEWALSTITESARHNSEYISNCDERLAAMQNRPTREVCC